MAASMGFEVPDEQSNGTNLHHWRDCLNSYVTSLRGKTKRNGWKYNDKSIREREANVRQFTHLINKPFVENYTAADIAPLQRAPVLIGPRKRHRSQ